MNGVFDVQSSDALNVIEWASEREIGEYASIHSPESRAGYAHVVVIDRAVELSWFLSLVDGCMRVCSPRRHKVNRRESRVRPREGRRKTPCHIFLFCSVANDIFYFIRESLHPYRKQRIRCHHSLAFPSVTQRRFTTLNQKPFLVLSAIM